jgi:hypothetical protein
MTKKKDASHAAAFLGARGGKKAAANMTKAEKTERAKKAAAKRWEKKKESS